jgi:hypothetical protein
VLWGTRGPEFKSRRPDERKPRTSRGFCLSTCICPVIGAIRNRKLNAEIATRELRELKLADALAFCLLLADVDPLRFDPTMAVSPGRYRWYRSALPNRKGQAR